MRYNSRILGGVAFGALMTVSPTFASAQDASNPTEAPAETTQSETASASGANDEDIVVTGIRGSLQSAQNRKRNAAAIVDSIVADDIGKLPDTNTTEALQRISGIQISRDRGEGGSVAIRGLSQVLTTLNGRQIFTADGGRGFNLQDLPAEILAGIDVYKTPTADLVEGGIGGVIDLRTRKPLDFPGFTISGTARARYNDLAEKFSPLASLLVSNRWDTGIGEMGILLSGSYQERAFRSDVISAGAPRTRADLIAGRNIVTPNGDYEPLINGNRRRIGFDGTFQWKPNADLEFYAQGSYQEFRSFQEQRGLNNPTNGIAVVPGSVTTFDGTDNFKSGTFVNLPISTYGVDRDTIDKNQQYAIGGNWRRDGAKLSFDVTYQKSSNDLYYSELDLKAIVPRATLDVSNARSAMTFSGIDLTNIANYQVGALTRSENHYDGDAFAARLDGEFVIDSPVLTGFKVGGRYQRLTIDFQPIRFFQNPPAGTQAAPFASLFERMPFNDYFRGTSQLPHDYLTAITSNLNGSNFEGVRRQLGFTVLPAVDPVAVYDMSEDTTAGYAQLLFGIDGPLRIDGNVGVRVVKTTLNVNGNQRVNGVVSAAPFTSNYINVLPSANVRFRFTDALQLRLSASQTLTRPSFSQLSPALTLVPAQGQGSGGNPNLNPLTADQLDASLEYYFSPTGSVYAAGFYRKVKGFIFSTGVNQNIGGIDYVITQPANGADGKIKGLEVGGQTFFDFLPGALSGFGVQANYTYISSDTPSAIPGYRTPLPNLSKNSFNVSGLYEKDGLSVRVAYNYRSDFLGSIYGLPLVPTGNQLLPVYTKGYGWLDASINYDITQNFTLTLEGSNLLRRKEITFYDQETLRGTYSYDDRQFMAGVRFKF